MAGAKTVFACDIFNDALSSLSKNIPDAEIHLGDIRKFTDFPEGDIVIGGYPCQGFSLAGKRLADDPRNFLYKEFVRTLELVKPAFFIAENVKGMLTMSKGEVIEAMVHEFAEQGYKVKYQLTNAKQYGVPQDRERVFIVGVREDVPFEYEFPVPTHGEGLIPYVSMKNAIGHFPEPSEDEIDQTGHSPRFLSRNRKRNWDSVSFTIQASGRQAPMHPSGEPMLKLGKDEWVFQGNINRKLSYIECAAIQTFPEDYILEGSLSNKYKMIGNAVPPLLAKAIAAPLVRYLNETKKEEIV